ncbi:hypothetical protein RSOLAG22IIIB_05303 [Rhizoctonia solani]|uniref:Hypervirulence associated protein TUDOR domain-containing protein n=1 Tax=Rhizoctonia solani TaxID=456999 RepID=A0A0K6G5A0_9AGAM|nr:hypothetical protein RSOLAG22IIIB_05303 [Rhizoctonia solani]
MLMEGDHACNYSDYQDVPQGRGRPEQCAETRHLIYPKGTTVLVQRPNGDQLQATIKEIIPQWGYVVADDDGNTYNARHDQTQLVHLQT